jgi:oligopeptide/dipeptide ABC transporter ATP-binding protein
MFDGNDITQRSTREVRPIRQKIQMVFQGPYASLKPRRRVRDLIAEPLRIHLDLKESEITRCVDMLLDQVGLLPDHASRYPHEFSGGQRQRIGIVLTGDVPSPINPPSGCHFHPRCPIAVERCKTEPPKLAEIATLEGLQSTLVDPIFCPWATSQFL